MAINIVSILNTIRANGSAEYQSRVPEATQTNITEVGSPVTTYQAMQNEFLTALINRIALVVIQNRTATNPLAPLKKGTIPLGAHIQELFTNMSKDNGYDGTGSKLLTKTKPDVKALYHTINRQGQYASTITKPDLQLAFTSFAEMEKLLGSIVTAMYSGDNYDEFILMKNLMATCIDEGKIVSVLVSPVTDETTAKAFIKAVKQVSSNIVFPSTNWNSYYANKPLTDTGEPIITWTPTEDQIIIIRADVVVETDVEVLAKAFNMDKVSFLANSITIDTFGTATDCLAILADRSWVQVYENLFETSDFYNSQGLFWNYWLNHWQTYSLSLFANAVAFLDGSVVRV